MSGTVQADGWYTNDGMLAGRPGAVDRALWARGIRPTRLSKYATSLAVLRPDLPAHPWTRSIRRHLPAAAGSGAAA